MANTQNLNDENRLVGQQLCSVLTAMDYITLKFVKYPLTPTGDFSDSALLDIEEGFEISNDKSAVVVRKDDDLGKFQRGATNLIELIGQLVTHAKSLPNGELEVCFESLASVRFLTSVQGFDSFNLTLKK